MTKIEDSLWRRRATGIYGVDKTTARPSVATIAVADRSRGYYVAIHNHTLRILRDLHKDARECAFPIEVDGLTYYFNAIISANGKLTCRFVVEDSGQDVVEEGYVGYPLESNILVDPIHSYNIQEACPLKEIAQALEAEIRAMVTSGVTAHVRTRVMTSMDINTGGVGNKRVGPTRKPTSYPLDNDAKAVAVHLITRKDLYSAAPTRTVTTLANNRRLEILVRKLDEGLWLSYRYDVGNAFQAIFIPLEFEGEAYIKFPKNPPWHDLKFGLGI